MLERDSRVSVCTSKQTREGVQGKKREEDLKGGVSEPKDGSIKKEYFTTNAVYFPAFGFSVAAADLYIHQSIDLCLLASLPA